MNAIPIEERLPSMAELNRLLSSYQKSNTRRSVTQLITSLVPYAALWVLMYFSLSISYFLTLALSVLAAGFLVRIFIMFHDCGHNSFFANTKLNKAVGFWLGALVFTPSEQWWKAHAIHHATSGNLDKRGTGDVMTWTLEEFVESGWEKQLGYRFFRHPLVMFGLGPLFTFVLASRLPLPVYGKRETQSVIFTNLAIIGFATIISLLIGFKAYVMIQLPVIWLAGFFGIWMFYIQHQFENNYWERNEKWDYVASALLALHSTSFPRCWTGSLAALATTTSIISARASRITTWRPPMTIPLKLQNLCASFPSARASAQSISKFGTSPSSKWTGFQRGTNVIVTSAPNPSSK
jgi:acyl-lipid omega-6 desaturase (Delta-12 desaturase)